MSRNQLIRKYPVLLILALMSLFSYPAMSQQTTRNGVYTEQQAVAGGSLYLRSCVECHGISLTGSEAGPALLGDAFWDKWSDQSMAAFYQITASNTPVNNPNGFSETK